jgi:hypothetical protein
MQVNGGVAMTKEQLLQKIIDADRDAWNFVSSAVIKGIELEKEYEQRFGEKPPAWPARGRW